MTTRFFDPSDPVPAVLTGLGALVLAGTLGYLVFVPAPNTSGMVAKSRMKAREIQLGTLDAKKKGVEVETLLAARKSSLPPDAVGPEALARITKLAQTGGLRLTGFRPQRTTESPSGLTIYAYSVITEGTFPATAKFVRAIEGSTRDIAVTSYNATSSDSASSVVSSTIGIALFGDTPKKASPRASTGAAGTSSAASASATAGVNRG